MFSQIFSPQERDFTKIVEISSAEIYIYVGRRHTQFFWKTVFFVQNMMPV